MCPDTSLCLLLSCSPSLSVFFFNDTATTEIYTLSLHDALPIFYCLNVGGIQIDQAVADAFLKALTPAAVERSEEHTSELQSHLNLVCRLLLEKKKKTGVSVRRLRVSSCDTSLTHSHTSQISYSS